jgi:hypothetical protein
MMAVIRVVILCAGITCALFAMSVIVPVIFSIAGAAVK